MTRSCVDGGSLVAAVDGGSAVEAVAGELLCFCRKLWRLNVLIHVLLRKLWLLSVLIILLLRKLRLLIVITCCLNRVHVPSRLELPVIMQKIHKLKKATKEI